MIEFNSELIHFQGIFKNELTTNILPFWMRFGLNKEGNGFHGAADLKGTPVLIANKSCVLNTRILWTFSEAARMYDSKEYANVAEVALNVVLEHFYDKEHGGFFMELAPDNSVVNDIKHTYVQAFAIYALSKYYEFQPSKKVLSVIQSSFHLLNQKAKDHSQLGYIESFTRDWNPIEENRMADNNEPRSMNTHLHLLEAWASLYKIWKDDEVKLQLTEFIEIFLNKIIRNSGHLGIFFDEDFNELESSKEICSYGHDIESSWLLWEAVEILGDESLKKQMQPIILKMVDAVERVGLDKDGGLFLESVRNGSHIRTNKHWWLQAETLVGFMNAYELTGDKKYFDKVKLSWSFIHKYVIDHEHGEWYTKVNRLGVPFLTEPEDDPSPYYRNDWKIDPWKCPYHNGRSMMELIHRINKLLK